MLVHAQVTDEMRIVHDVVNGRSVTATGQQWLDWKDGHAELLRVCKRANAMLDNLMKAVPWGKTFDLDVEELNGVLCDLPAAIANAEKGA